MGSWIIYVNFIFPIITKMFIPDGRFGVVVTLVVDWLVIPLGLVFLNIYLLNSKILISPYKACAFMVGGFLLGDFVGYLIWGVTSGKLLNPDGETLWIIQWLVIYHVVFCFLFLGIYKAVEFFLIKK